MFIPVCKCGENTNMQKDVYIYVFSMYIYIQGYGCIYIYISVYIYIYIRAGDIKSIFFRPSIERASSLTEETYTVLVYIP